MVPKIRIIPLGGLGEIGCARDVGEIEDSCAYERRGGIAGNDGETEREAIGGEREHVVILRDERVRPPFGGAGLEILE